MALMCEWTPPSGGSVLGGGFFRDTLLPTDPCSLAIIYCGYINVKELQLLLTAELFLDLRTTEILKYQSPLHMIQLIHVKLDTT